MCFHLSSLAVVQRIYMRDTTGEQSNMIHLCITEAIMVHYFQVKICFGNICIFFIYPLYLHYLHK